MSSLLVARAASATSTRLPVAFEANEGRPVDVVFEMSGGEVFDASYKALAPFGRIVAYGIATSRPNEVSTGSLLRHSRAVVGFWLMHCLGRPAMVDEALVVGVHALAVVEHGEVVAKLRFRTGDEHPGQIVSGWGEFRIQREHLLVLGFGLVVLILLLIDKRQ